MYLSFKCSLYFIGFFTPFVYTTAKAISIGEERDQATLLISMIGIANTVGRVAAGWFSDRPWANALQINNVALILAGVTSCVVPYLNNYPLLAIYCVVFGLCIGKNEFPVRVYFQCLKTDGAAQVSIEVEDHSFVCYRNVSIKLCAQIRTGRAMIGCY